MQGNIIIKLYFDKARNVSFTFLVFLILRIIQINWGKTVDEEVVYTSNKPFINN